MPGRADGETAEGFEGEVAGMTQSFVDGSCFLNEFNLLAAPSCKRHDISVRPIWRETSLDLSDKIRSNETAS
jgi:hypothetical protein